MNRDDLENLLVAYGRSKRDAPILSDAERANLQASIQSQSEQHNEGTDKSRSHERTRWRRIRIGGAIGLLTAMAASIMFLATKGETDSLIKSFQVERLAQRGSSERFDAIITLNQPAHISVVLVDDRRERWLMPFAGDPPEYVRRVESQESLSLPLLPNPSDRRGPGRAQFVMLIASATGSPTPDQLLSSVPEPVTSEPGEPQRVYKALAQHASQLEQRFGCSVQVQQVPQ